MKKRVKEMEEEAAKIEAIQTQYDSKLKGGAEGDGPEIDSRSIYVGGVDYSATKEDVEAVFQACGVVNRVTIPTDKYTGPKGFAYVEFQSADAIANAMLLNGTEFKGRELKISPKRTNVPFGDRGRGRGRGAPRGGGRGGGGYPPPGARFRRRPPPFYDPYAYGGYAPRRRFRRATSYAPY